MLSPAMQTALAQIARANAKGRMPYIAQAYPDQPVYICDYHGMELQGRTIKALWERGLLTFEVRAQLTSEGKRAIQNDIRIRPGEREFTVVSGDETGDGDEAQ